MSRKIVVLNGPTSGSLPEDIFKSKDELEEKKKLQHYTVEKSKAELPDIVKKKKKSKIYFDENTENAIVEYSKEKNPAKKNKIYNEKIKYSFEKLAENIINTFSFSYIPESYEDIKAGVISHMIIKMDMYQKDKGKAFSYFSIMVKNYLIILNNQYYAELKSNYSIQAGEKSDQYEFDIMDEDFNIQNKKQDNSEFIKLIVEYWEKNIPYVFKKKRDMDIAQAVLELLSNVSSLEFFNKKALYLLIREMTGHKTQYITRVLTKMQSHYGAIKSAYYTNGELENMVFFKKKSKK